MSAEMIQVHSAAHDFDSIPVIDFAGMLGDDPEAKAEVAGEAAGRLHQCRLLLYRHHGAPRNLLEDVLGRMPALLRPAPGGEDAAACEEILPSLGLCRHEE